MDTKSNGATTAATSVGVRAAENDDSGVIGWRVMRDPIAAKGEKSPRAISGSFQVKSSAEQYVELAKAQGIAAYLAPIAWADVVKKRGSR